jgi:hypothetical protein
MLGIDSRDAMGTLEPNTNSRPSITFNLWAFLNNNVIRKNFFNNRSSEEEIVAFFFR